MRGSNKLGIDGDFEANLLLDGTGAPKSTLGNVNVEGELSGTWNITGDTGKIVAGIIQGDWDAEVTGAIKGVTIHDEASVTITAASLKSMTVHGSLFGSLINLSQDVDDKIDALGKLVVKDTIELTQIRTVGNVGTITCGAVISANIFAGVDDLVTTLPDDAGDFTSHSTLSKLNIKGLKTLDFSCADSNIAAWTMRSLSLGVIETDNGGMEFGIAADSIKSLKFFDGLVTVKLSNLDDPADSGSDGDAVLRLF